jgi:hypothetical protein
VKGGGENERSEEQGRGREREEKQGRQSSFWLFTALFSALSPPLSSLFSFLFLPRMIVV